MPSSLASECSDAVKYAGGVNVARYRPQVRPGARHDRILPSAALFGQTSVDEAREAEFVHGLHIGPGYERKEDEKVNQTYSFNNFSQFCSAWSTPKPNIS